MCTPMLDTYTEYLEQKTSPIHFTVHHRLQSPLPRIAAKEEQPHRANICMAAKTL